MTIQPISDVLALAFMSCFPEMKEGEQWLDLCQWVGEGKKTPLLNLAVIENGVIVGLFPCEVHPDKLMIHACFQHGHRGEYAVNAAREAFEWIWENTIYSKITAYIEPDHVKRYALRCGMTEKDGLFEVTK